MVSFLILIGNKRFRNPDTTPWEIYNTDNKKCPCRTNLQRRFVIVGEDTKVCPF